MTPSGIRRGIVAILTVSAIWSVAAATDTRPDRWLRVDYGALVDGRKLTHSGEPVGAMLKRLGGRSDDALAYRLLDPILEPYVFVLSDALDSLGAPSELPLVEVGSLWEPGEAQPAWVELVRARRYLLESDGEGHLRACLPATSVDASQDPVEAAKAAWDEAWPVLRHALAGERRRLVHRRGGAPPAIEVSVHAYRHDLARGVFDLGVTPWKTTVTETGSRIAKPPIDIENLKSILDRGLRIEGGRLEPSGRVRWFTTDSDRKPTILGRPLSLADVAVAYRAVVRGGNGEPYMSLDRASAPHVADVNYGGRLRDTALGMVSLLADVRFKTFSVGVDLLGDGDVREAVRRVLPDFKTHLERFAADPSAGAILNQQTRFWFYPDDVDLTLSAEGDVLAFRKVRMTAASERVVAAGATQSDPPWTKDNVAFLNAHYEALAKLFPEMADLDESVRLLSLFTWLEAAKGQGLAVPDLDVLLAVELPALATPRRFPQLLTHDVLPAAGAAGVVDVLDRTDVGDALDRLEPNGTQPLPAPVRFARDRAMLNPQNADQAALASEMAALPANAPSLEQDLLAYRAERLLMHARVLATIPAERRATIETRRKQEPATRVFSVGIGGVDLGMNAVFARARGRGGKLAMASRDPAAPKQSHEVAPPAVQAPAAAPVADPPGLSTSEWPDHGLGPAAERTTTDLPEGKGKIVSRRLPGASVRRGSFKSDNGAAVAWDEVALGMDGPEGRARRREAGPAGVPVFTRFEDGRSIIYKFVRDGNVLRATPATSALPDAAFGDAPPAHAATEPPPPGLTVMDRVRADPASVEIRIVGANGRERGATLPRALLQRLVRGRAIDLTPERPLPGFTPASDMLGESRVLMVMSSSDETRAPWAGATAVGPGEDDAARLAKALTRWWSADGASPARAIVGTDPATSTARWARAPKLDGTLTVLDSGTHSGLDGVPSKSGATVVLVISDEPAGLLGRRLRAMATDPAFTGKILAVAALGGRLRADLPASLLREGRLAALGVLETGPVGQSRSIAELAQWARRVSGEVSKGIRAEDPLGPFTWFY